MAWGDGFREQGDTGWYWTTTGKLKLARGGRERRVRASELVDPHQQRLAAAAHFVTKTVF